MPVYYFHIHCGRHALADAASKDFRDLPSALEYGLRIVSDIAPDELELVEVEVADQDLKLVSFVKGSPKTES